MLFTPKNLLDFHTHSLRNKDLKDVAEIVSIHLGQEKERQYFTVGLHPWWTTTPVTPQQQNQLLLLLADEYCLAMGEMGLDRLKGPAMNIQMEVLRSQLVIAEQLNKPVIIHCVRAFDQLIQIKKEFPNIKKWCVHGYGRHVILAKQLIAHGFYLSLMPSPPAKYQSWFESLPMEKLFLETDSMPDVTIQQIYTLVSEAAGLDFDELCVQMNKNASEFFEK